MRKYNKKIVTYTTIYSLILLAITLPMLIFVCLNKCSSDKPLSSSGIKWGGNNITVNRDKNEKYIAIPCFTDLTFRANQTAQKVNIYNPEENECIMDFSIVLSDGTVIWESDNTFPGYGFHDIELTKPLSSGTYEARLTTRCFTIDKKSELNGNSFKFKINVEGE